MDWWRRCAGKCLSMVETRRTPRLHWPLRANGVHHEDVTNRMRDPAFRRYQREHLYDPHVAPLNHLVDQLAQWGRGWLPHVAPIHGGTQARLLWVLRDPGRATVDPDGHAAGFLCVENADPTAERLCELLDHAGVGFDDTAPWNAYPWYINRAPSAAELRVGAEPLRLLLGLLVRVEVVVLLGNEARRMWEDLVRSHPDVAQDIEVLRTRHTGRQAFIGTAAQRTQWRTEQEEVFARAAQRLRESSAR